MPPERCKALRDDTLLLKRRFGSRLGCETLQVLCDLNEVCSGCRSLSFKGFAYQGPLDGKLQKFAEKLSTYDYDIFYRPGKNNFVADLLSFALFNISPAMAATMALEMKEAE